MLYKARQQLYFNEAWQSMRGHLLAFCKTRNPEELHRFRVQVKRITALVLYLQKDPKGRDISQKLKPLKSIFQQAGRIRSAHINLRLIGQYSLHNPIFKNEQETIAKSETGRFCIKRGKYVKTLKRLRKAFSGNFQDIDDKFVSSLYQKQLKQLSRLFAQPDAPVGKLHNNRKKIKNLLYLHEALPKPLAGKINLNTPYLDRLQDAIGKWHDVVLGIELLQAEGNTDKKTMAALNRQSRRMRASIYALAGGFGAKAVHSLL